MTKGEMRDSVKNALRKIDSTARYHDRVVDQAIEHSMNQFLYDIYRKDPRDLDQYMREYGMEVALPVLQNESTEYYYTNIPAPYVVFPDKQSGIRYVVAHNRDKTLFYPMSMQEMLIADRTYIGSATAEDGDPYTRSFYIVRGTTAIYYNINSDIRCAGVRMGIIIPFSEYADDEEVRVPFGQNDKTFVAVMQKMAQTPPVELKDNNKDVQ
jgi:hypothetical protein